MNGLNLDTLRDYYKDGWSAMGKPNDLYYIHTKKGILSLQGYITERAFAGDTYDRSDGYIQEVSVDGTTYNQTSINEDEFMDRLRQDSTKRFLTTLAGAKAPTFEFAREFVSGVYDGNWDKDVWIDCMMDDPMSYNQLRDSFKAELINRLDSQYDSMTEAAFNSYVSILAKESRTFAGDDVEASDQLMRKAVRDYTNRVVSDDDQYPNQEFVSVDTVDRARSAFAEGFKQCKEEPKINKRFTSLMSYLSKGIVIDMSTSGRTAHIVSDTEMQYDPATIGKRSLDEIEHSIQEDELPVSMMTDAEIEKMAEYLTQYLKDNPNMDVEELDEAQLMVNFVGGISNFVGTNQSDKRPDDSSQVKDNGDFNTDVEDDGPDL